MKFSFTISGILMLIITQDNGSYKNIFYYFTNIKSLKFIWVGFLPLIAYLLSASLSVPVDSLSLNVNSSYRDYIYIIGFSSSSGILFYMFFRGGFGEEIGLRGYILPLLLEHIKPLRASMIIGLFWAIWHYPVWIHRGILVLVILTLVVLAWSVIFTYVFLKTKSLWIVILLHSTNNSGDDIIEFTFPQISNFDWELYYTLLIVISGIVLSFYVNKLRLETS